MLACVVMQWNDSQGNHLCGGFGDCLPAHCFPTFSPMCNEDIASSKSKLKITKIWYMASLLTTMEKIENILRIN